MYIQQSLFLVTALFLGFSTTAPTPATPIRLPLRRITKNNELNKRDFLSSLDHPLLSNSPLSTSLLNDIDLFQYGIEVQVGTPGQEFLLLFDTGSSDTWIPSQKCTKEKGCLSGRQYDPSQSTTYQGELNKVNITYGIGAATGHYFVDRLQVGDQANLGIPSQTLVLIDDNQGPIAQQSTANDNNEQDDNSLLSPTSSNQHPLIDGIFAAGFPAGTLMAQQKQHDQYTPYPIGLWENKLIPAPLFSLTMDEGSTQATGSDWIGEVMFGAVDDSKHTDVIQYTSVIKRNDGVYSHWMVGVNGFQYDNGTNMNFHFTEPTHFLVDSGSNFMYLPKGLSDQLADVVSKGTATWTGATYRVDCALMDENNNDGKALLNVMFPQLDNNTISFAMSVPVARLVGKNGADDQCILYFAPSQTSNVFTLGNLWLRHFVSVFNFGDYRVGFSPLA
ncbi:aspartic peptidase domain-containing protein [Halteromyces radiatus]|uniref:aspartic peptidase domain-containing protein n=1 Tax=Halteromyces radiatus TaxID=101107 RepID=UPI00221F1EA0|nr:aspartic peptidase domain-containing protein [Halteromyces radiatus]KAI8089322.1 aspartic peptidase domain-containing protein [Halteromyces radiatus]